MAEYMDIARIDDWNDLSIIDDNGNATYVYDVGELPKANVIPIPDNATNGDMIKAMFPDCEQKENIHNGYFEMYFDGDFGNPSYMRVSKDWWNAPYKRKVEE